jgi:hypothetical protein
MPQYGAALYVDHIVTECFFRQRKWKFALAQDQESGVRANRAPGGLTDAEDRRVSRLHDLGLDR